MRQLYLFLDNSERLLLDALNNTNSNSGPHVSDGETTKWPVLEEGLDNEWLGGDHLDDTASIALATFTLIMILLLT